MEPGALFGAFPLRLFKSLSCPSALSRAWYPFKRYLFYPGPRPLVATTAVRCSGMAPNCEATLHPSRLEQTPASATAPWCVFRLEGCRGRSCGGSNLSSPHETARHLSPHAQSLDTSRRPINLELPFRSLLVERSEPCLWTARVRFRGLSRYSACAGSQRQDPVGQPNEHRRQRERWGQRGGACLHGAQQRGRGHGGPGEPLARCGTDSRARRGSPQGYACLSDKGGRQAIGCPAGVSRGGGGAQSPLSPSMT